MTRREPRERGFALVVVLWAAIILAILTGGVVGMARTGLRIAAHQTSAAALRTSADAALNLLLLQLIDPRGAPMPRLDGVPFEMTFEGRTMRLTVQDQAGKIDLNSASGTVLQSLLVACGLDDSAAAALTDKILDWRERWAGKRVNGAKADDYRAAGYPYGPREDFFPRVEELKLVMGMTRSVYDRIAPALTVYSQSPAVDINVAPPAVLRLLPDMDPDKVQQILGARADPDAGGDQSLAVQSAPTGGMLIGHAVEITVVARAADDTMATRTAIVRFTGQQQAPLWIYRWD
jgi:general secretion pathway protein K